MAKKKIKNVPEDISINKNVNSKFKYPVFCFRYLQPCSYNKCKEPKFFIDFLERMQKLGNLGWDGINKSHKHSFGTEKMPVKDIKPQCRPSILTPDVEHLTVFRANGNNLPFLGIKLDNVFQVIYIESCFGEIYDHK